MMRRPPSNDLRRNLGVGGTDHQIVNMTGWIIAAGEHRIPWRTSLAAHRMLLVINPNGEVVRQLNGLASWFDAASGTWRHKPIGYLRSDRLRGYDTKSHPRTWLPINGLPLAGRNAISALENGEVVALFGSNRARGEAQIEAAIAPALAALRRINSSTEGPDGGAGLAYPFLGLGPNSNSFFSTLVRAMGLEEPRFASPARLAPGTGKLLLAEHEMAQIRDRFRSNGPLEA